MVVERQRIIETCLRRVVEAKGPRRLLHGRGGCFPGFERVNVDWYPPYVVIGCFADDDVEDIASALFDLDVVSGVVAQARQGRATTARAVRGDVPSTFACEESGLQFKIDPYRNQNVGLFLDIAPVRAWLREHAEGARVLNLFAYTCAFSVHALAGGAELVVNNDMSRAALDWGLENHRLNHQDLGRVKMLPHNVFKSWWKLRQLGPFDVVIVDPPTRQRGSFVAEKDYGQVMKRLPSLVADGGKAVVCLNSPFLPFRFVEEQMSRRCPEAVFQSWLPGAPEFEEVDANAGLKVGLYRF